MPQGERIEFPIPERLNLGSYYLDVNLDQGRGDKAALFYRDETYTFRDLWLLTNKIGNVLKTLGVEPENRVLLVLADSPDWVATWLAALKIGAVGTHAYTYLNAHDYEHVLRLVRPKVVVVDGRTLERLRQARCDAKSRAKLLVAGPAIQDLREGEVCLEEMVRSADHSLEVEPTHRDDLACWNFSGGTTDRPKAVPHTHRDGLVGCEAYNFPTSYRSDDIILRVPKLFFHYSRDAGCFWPLHHGASVVLFPEKATAALLFDLVKKHRPTVLINVPTMMRAMIATPEPERADLSCVRRCMSSGELLSAQLYREWVSAFGGEVENRFGSAESAMGYLASRRGAVVPGSSGVVTPLSEVKLVDEQGAEVPRGKPGVLMARVPAAGLQYVRESEKSRTTFLGNGWVDTGDLFIQDDNDYFWFVGRANELIKVSGVWVSPFEIEQTLQASPHIKECAVIGVEDENGLMNVWAFVVLKDRTEAAVEISKELKKFCKVRLAPHKFPRVIEFTQELPKTGSGKIDRLLLRQRALESRNCKAPSAPEKNLAGTEQPRRGGPRALEAAKGGAK